MAETNRLQDKVLPLLIAAIFAAVGFGGVGYNVWKTHQALGYVEGSGSVVSAKVETHRSTHKGRTRTSYSPCVAYRYVVDGRTYGGNRYGFGSWSDGDWRVAQKTVDEYPSGKAVSVWYDPKNPSSSYLLKPKMTGCLPVAGFFSLFALVGSILFIVVLKSKPGSVQFLFGRREDPDRFEREDEAVDVIGWEMMPPDGISVERSYETQALILTYRMRNWLALIFGVLVCLIFPFIGGGMLLDMFLRGVKVNRPEDLVMILLPAFFLLIPAIGLVASLYQGVGRQELTISREGSKFFYGIGGLGFTRKMMVDFRTKVSVLTTYRGKQHTPYYIVRLESDGRSVKTFATPKAELARGLQDFIRVQLARI